MSDYSASIIDDNEQIRKLLYDLLSFKNFTVDTYEYAETFVDKMKQSTAQNHPDLIVTDLELTEGKMQGLDLIASLVKRNVKSELVAITGHLSSSALVENAVCFGAACCFTKPFNDILDFAKQLIRLAEIGKKRRLSHSETDPINISDPDRAYRPVFLSYSTKDEILANGLRRNIEMRQIDVWYAPTSIEGGELWQKKIKDGIKKAPIFLALITDNYLQAGNCLAELDQFLEKLNARPAPQLLFLPVFGEISDQSLNTGLMQKILSQYQCIKLYPQLTDALTTVLGTIQNHIARNISNPSEKALFQKSADKNRGPLREN